MKKGKTNLKEAKGDMYSFVSHTWNPIKGKCGHGCGYCYMNRLGEKAKPVRLDEKLLNDDLGTGNFIFVVTGTDMFAENVDKEAITKILDYCEKFDNKYLFQSKNPERFMEFIEHPVFKKSVICTTIETNRYYPVMGNAPSVEERVSAIEIIKSETDVDVYVTIEPIMDFDLPEMIDLIRRCNPVQVNIGADSKGNKLPEPTKEKAEKLIVELNKFTTVKEKKNLARLTDTEKVLKKELTQAKKQQPKSELMKVQIMTKIENGYLGNDENRKLGLIKENRPIRKSDVDGFLQIMQSGIYDGDTQAIVTIEASELSVNIILWIWKGMK